MVTHKRKVNSDRDRYGSFDTTIEIDELDYAPRRQSVQNGSYRDTYNMGTEIESLTYTPRRDTAHNYVAVPVKTEKQRQAKLHEIKKAPVAVKASGKQALSSRTKLILAAYITVAVILAAIVIGTGLAVSGTGTRVDALEHELAAQTQILGEQELRLYMLNNDTYMTGLAAEHGMQIIQSYTVVDLIELQPIADFEASTNWFDSVSRFFSRIFAR